MPCCLTPVAGLLAAALMNSPALAQAVPERPPATDYQPQVGQSGKDVVWVPTPDEVVDKMLEMATVKPGDRVVDLGSGDGKIAIAAAKRGAIARGFKSDFRDADVITLYLLPALNEQLRPILLDMKPGTRVTSHQFRMGDWEPDRSEFLASREAHLWIVPAKVQGLWQLRIGDAGPIELKLAQTYQKLSGQATIGGRPAALTEARIDGANVSFTLPAADPAAPAGSQAAGWRFEGRLAAPGRLVGDAIDARGKRVAFIAMRRPGAGR